MKTSLASLAYAVDYASTAAAFEAGARTANGVGHLVDLVDAVVRAAVARDRAAGITWDEIGDGLGLHPDTARRRYGTPGQEATTPTTREAHAR